MLYTWWSWQKSDPELSKVSVSELSLNTDSNPERVFVITYASLLVGAGGLWSPGVDYTHKESRNK